MGRARSGETYLVPDSYARQVVKKGYATYVEDEEESDKDAPFTEKETSSETKDEREKEKEKESQETKGGKDFEELGIPQRIFPSQVFGAIKAEGIHTFGDLLEYKEDYTEIKGIGPSFASDIENGIEKARKLASDL